MAAQFNLESSRGCKFDNHLRNSFITTPRTLPGGEVSTPVVPPKHRKTGTTVVGLRLGDCVILGADTRATAGDIVVDKNCEKIHYIADQIRCCGAGSAADNIHVLEQISASVRLHAQAQGRAPRVRVARRMLEDRLFKYQGHLSVFAIMGGWDPVDGPQLFDIWPHGSSDSENAFQVGGSGMIAAMSVFETKYRPDLTRDEGVALVIEAVQAGIFNDLGSGSNVDVCIISADGTDYRRNVFVGNNRSFPSGAAGRRLPDTRVLEEARVMLDTLVDVRERRVVVENE